MFVGLVMPLLSKYFTADIEMFRAVFQKTFDFLAIIVVPLAAGGIYCAPALIRILAGSGLRRRLCRCGYCSYSRRVYFLRRAFWKHDHRDP